MIVRVLPLLEELPLLLAPVEPGPPDVVNVFSGSGFSSGSPTEPTNRQDLKQLWPEGHTHFRCFGHYRRRIFHREAPLPNIRTGLTSWWRS